MGGLHERWQLACGVVAGCAATILAALVFAPDAEIPGWLIPATGIVILVALVAVFLPGPEPSGKLTITKAEYGYEPTWIDVTETVRKRSRGHQLDMQVDHDLFDVGDPCPGRRKQLAVTCTIRGRANGYRYRFWQDTRAHVTSKQVRADLRNRDG